MPTIGFSLLRSLLVTVTGKGYDRSPWLNNVHHKLSYRLHKLLPTLRVKGLQRVQVPALEGRHMYVRAEDGGVAHQLIMYREYEPYETSVLRQYLGPGMIVYNIGANLGYYVLHAADAVGSSGKVYAFEPATENVKLLRRAISENHVSNVTVIDQAVGATVGEAALALSGSNSGDHQLREMEGREHVRVGVTTVDSLVAEGMMPPDAVILDVQGSELDVLIGMKGLLATHRPHMIFTEFWPQGLNERSPNGAKRFLELLVGSGFKLQVIDEKGKTLDHITVEALLTSTTGHQEKNLLCTRSV